MDVDRHEPAVLSERREAATALMWIYFLGEVTGRDIKIGVTRSSSIRDRRRAIDNAQMSDDRYVLLAGLLGPSFAEVRLGEYFAEYRASKGARREYYEPAEALIEYILWLRQQWYICHDENESNDGWPEEPPDHWLPTPQRREPRPLGNVGRLFDDQDVLAGPLAGTYWSWMPDLVPTFQDYFTPPDLVHRAGAAMGGIDLDAASHFLAHKRLHQNGVVIPEFFHVGKSAFTHDWHGRVWLNPPYGDNERWFGRAEAMLNEGRVTQLCMLSPTHAFTTQVAQSMVRRSSAAVLLSPTPAFYNPSDPTKTGTNLPHSIFYWGTRVSEFLASFNDSVGIPFELRWTGDGAPETERLVAV